MPDQPVSLLQRRRIEAQFAQELLRHLVPEVGLDKARDVLRATTTAMAYHAGEQLAAATGTDQPTLEPFRRIALPLWQQDDALTVHYLEAEPGRLSFNVTRCRYAEMYRELGLADLGEVLSCTRDGELGRGFNPRIHLTRTQTIMQGATHCDFRYVLEEEKMAADEHG